MLILEKCINLFPITLKWDNYVRFKTSTGYWRKIYIYRLFFLPYICIFFSSAFSKISRFLLGEEKKGEKNQHIYRLFCHLFRTLTGSSPYNSRLLIFANAINNAFAGRKWDTGKPNDSIWTKIFEFLQRKKEEREVFRILGCFFPPSLH